MRTLLLLFCASPLAAYQLLSLSTQPETVHIGDRTLVTLVLQLGEHEQISVPDTLPQSVDLDLISLDYQLLEQRQARIEIVLAPFRSGPVELPPLPLGNLRLEQLHFPVASLLEDTSLTFRPELPPLMPPRAFFHIALTLVVATLGPLLLYFLIRRYRKPLWKRTKRRLTRLRDILRLHHALVKLQRYCETKPPEQFCKTLSVELRIFLSSRLKRPCLSYAPVELRLVLSGEEGWAPLFAALEFCDRVRFARQASSPQQSLHHLRQLRQLLPRLNRLEAAHEPQS